MGEALEGTTDGLARSCRRRALGRARAAGRRWRARTSTTIIARFRIPVGARCEHARIKARTSSVLRPNSTKRLVDESDVERFDLRLRNSRHSGVEHAYLF